MPDDQVEIYSEEIKNVNVYSIKIKKSLVEGRLIKIRFISNEGEDKNRDLLIESGDSSSAISASLDEDSSFKSLILEQQLKVELGRGEIASFEDVKARFQTLNKTSVDGDMELLGDKAALRNMFLSDKYREIAAELLAVHRLAIEQKNDDEASAVLEKLVHYGLEAGVIYYKCPELMMEKGKSSGDSKQICTIATVPDKDEAPSLEPAYDQIDERILSDVSFEGIGKFEEGQLLLSKAYEATLQDLKERVSAAKIDAKQMDLIFEAQIPVAKALFESRLKQLDAYLNPQEMSKK